jgi:protein SCO1
MKGWCRSVPMVVLLALSVAGCDRMRDAIDRMRSGGVIHGTTITPAVAKPDVTLTDARGQPFDLARDTKGKVTFLTFGYTHCPDICPIHMANLAGAMRLLPATVRARVAVVFVTTDPARDSLPRLRQWLDSFDPSFIGLRGTDAELSAMEQAFHVSPAVREPQAGGGYTMTHSAQVFAFTPDDSAHVIYLPGVTSADYAHDIPRLLRNVYK